MVPFSGSPAKCGQAGGSGGGALPMLCPGRPHRMQVEERRESKRRWGGRGKGRKKRVGGSTATITRCPSAKAGPNFAPHVFYPLRQEFVTEASTNADETQFFSLMLPLNPKEVVQTLNWCLYDLNKTHESASLILRVHFLFMLVFSVLP